MCSTEDRTHKHRYRFNDTSFLLILFFVLYIQQCENIDSLLLVDILHTFFFYASNKLTIHWSRFDFNDPTKYSVLLRSCFMVKSQNV